MFDMGDAPPGPDLAAVLAELDDDALEQVDDYDLVEIIAAWSRMTAWAQAHLAQAAAMLSRRRSMLFTTPEPGRAPTRILNTAAHEIAMRLSITRQAAHRTITTGRALTGALTPVGDALATGLIDLPRAQAFVDALASSPMETAEVVQAQVLPHAPHRTAPELTRDLAAALITTDPEEATDRHHRARERRCVHHPRPLPDGMASIYAILPAVDALALDLALETAARTAKTDGDRRSTDHLRADALATLAHHALTTGWIGNPSDAGDSTDAGDATGKGGSGSTERTSTSVPDGDRTDGADAPQAPADTDTGFGRGPGFRLGRIGGQPPRIKVTVPLAVLLGREGDAERHDAAHQNGVERPDSTVEHDSVQQNGVVEHDGAEQPGGVIEHDGVEQPGTSEDAATGSADHDAQPHGPDPTLHPPSPRWRTDVAILDGIGPITDDVARALALGGTWQRLITDPTSGVVTDVGRTRYRPPADLAALVRARDSTCTRPGCAVPAHHCQLDHTTPFHLGGPTALGNLGDLCPSDHTHKTAGAYDVQQVRPGVFDFTLPSGHTYRRELGGDTHRLPRRRRRRRNSDTGSGRTDGRGSHRTDAIGSDRTDSGQSRVGTTSARSTGATPRPPDRTGATPEDDPPPF